MSPMGQRLQKAPQTRGRGQGVEGKYQPTCRGARPWEENIVGWQAWTVVRRTTTDQAHSTGPPEGYGLNENRGPPH
jgi:hypothetical protein